MATSSASSTTHERRRPPRPRHRTEAQHESHPIGEGAEDPPARGAGRGVPFPLRMRPRRHRAGAAQGRAASPAGPGGEGDAQALRAGAAPTRAERCLMATAQMAALTLRLECDLRHGLVEPTITREPAGPVLSLVHGQTYLRLALSEHSLRALGLAILTSVGSEG